MQRGAPQTLQRNAIAGVDGQFESPLHEPQRKLVVVCSRLRARRIAIGAWRLTVGGPVEMLGAQNGITLRIPLRGAPMQFAPLALQQPVIHGVANERVVEDESIALSMQQAADHHRFQRHVRPVENVAHGVLLEELPEHRGRPQYRFVRGIESVQPCLHETLHRTRHPRARRPVRIAEQLFEKQRIARGPFDATSRQVIRARKRSGQRTCV
ncbi:MAG TPA: hypothetical protein VN289_12005, partial [Paraburkholderia sp.]|nr:hypothetical protein [Paraburkholderia sp.]